MALLVFCASVAIGSMYPDKIPTQLPGTLTHPLALADLASGSTHPNSSLQQLPLSNHCLSLTVTNSSLLPALGPCLSPSSSGLIGNLMYKPFVWVSHQNKQRNPLTGAYPHPYSRNECLPSCHNMLNQDNDWLLWWHMMKLVIPQQKYLKFIDQFWIISKCSYWSKEVGKSQN